MRESWLECLPGVPLVQIIGYLDVWTLTALFAVYPWLKEVYYNSEPSGVCFKYHRISAPTTELLCMENLWLMLVNCTTREGVVVADPHNTTRYHPQAVKKRDIGPNLFATFGETCSSVFLWQSHWGCFAGSMSIMAKLTCAEGSPIVEVMRDSQQLNVLHANGRLELFFVHNLLKKNREVRMDLYGHSNRPLEEAVAYFTTKLPIDNIRGTKWPLYWNDRHLYLLNRPLLTLVSSTIWDVCQIKKTAAHALGYMAVVFDGTYFYVVPFEDDRVVVRCIVKPLLHHIQHRRDFLHFVINEDPFYLTIVLRDKTVFMVDLGIHGTPVFALPATNDE